MHTLIATRDFDLFKSELSGKLKESNTIASFRLQLMMESLFYEAQFKTDGMLTICIPRNRKIEEELFPKNLITLQNEEKEIKQIMATLAPDATLMDPQTQPMA